MKWKKPLAILVLAFLTATLFIGVVGTAVAEYRDDGLQTTNSWTSVPPGMYVEWNTDTSMHTNKGGRVCFSLFWYTTSAQIVTFRTRLVGYNSSWVTGWRIDTLMSDYPTNAFSTAGGVQTEGGMGSWGTYTDTFYKTAVAGSATSGYCWGAFIDVPATTSQSSVSVQFNVTDANSITRYQNATINIYSTNLTYNIDVAKVDDLPEEIEPDDTVSARFSITNSGTKTVDVVLEGILAIADSDGTALSTSAWTVQFKDYSGNKINVKHNIGASQSVTCYVVLLVPSADDAPEGAEVTLSIHGAVCNDTRYADILAIGGEDARTSTDFTGDGEEETALWWIDYQYYILAVFIIALIIIGYLYYQGYNFGGKRTRRKK